MAHIVNFSLDPQVDRDIIRWLDAQSNRSAAIRTAIRAYMAKEEGPTLADVLAEIRALPTRFNAVPRDSTPDESAGNEPPAAAANLDGLLDRLGGLD